MLLLELVNERHLLVWWKQCLYLGSARFEFFFLSHMDPGESFCFEPLHQCLIICCCTIQTSFNIYSIVSFKCSGMDVSLSFLDAAKEDDFFTLSFASCNHAHCKKSLLEYRALVFCLLEIYTLNPAYLLQSKWTSQDLPKISFIGLKFTLCKSQLLQCCKKQTPY